MNNAECLVSMKTTRFEDLPGCYFVVILPGEVSQLLVKRVNGTICLPSYEEYSGQEIRPDTNVQEVRLK